MQIGDTVKVVKDTTKDGSITACIGKHGTIVDVAAYYVVVCLGTHPTHDYMRDGYETTCDWWGFTADEIEVLG